MNRVFVDTSAILALLVPQDRFHERASNSFHRLSRENSTLITTSYVLVETYALVGRRLGLEAVRALREDFAPLLELIWVDEDLHEAGLDLLLQRENRDLSFVDALSLVAMDRTAVDGVFAFDAHLTRAGVPAV